MSTQEKDDGPLGQRGRPITKDGIPIADRPAWKTIRDLLPYLWLEGRWDLRWRVIGAVTCLIVARGLGLWVPFIYKDIIDGLGGTVSRELLFALSPVFVIVVYGTVQIVYLIAVQGQRALMIRVSEALFRTLSTRAFDHVMSLSMAFHLTRRTASLARIVNRGAARADLLLNIAVFQIMPMAIEFVLILGLIVGSFGWFYVGVILVTALVYLTYTLLMAEWRKKFHRAYIEAS